MADQTLKLIIAGDAKGAQTALSDVAKGSSDANTALGGTSTAMGLLGRAASGLASIGVAAWVAEGAEKAKGAEAAWAGLRVAVDNSGASFADAKPAIDATLKGLSDTSAISKGALRDGLTELVTKTGDLKKSMELLPLVANIVDFQKLRGVEMSAADAAKQVGLVMNGNTKILKQYGITTEKGGTAAGYLAQMMDKVKGSDAAFLATAEGKTEALNNKMSALQTTIGERLLPAESRLTEVQSKLLDVAVKLPAPIQDGALAVEQLAGYGGSALGPMGALAGGLIGVTAGVLEWESSLKVARDEFGNSITAGAWWGKTLALITGETAKTKDSAKDLTGANKDLTFTTKDLKAATDDLIASTRTLGSLNMNSAQADLRAMEAHQAIIDKTKALNEAKKEGTKTASELRIMTQEVKVAQMEATRADEIAASKKKLATDATNAHAGSYKTLREDVLKSMQATGDSNAQPIPHKKVTSDFPLLKEQVVHATDAVKTYTGTPVPNKAAPTTFPTAERQIWDAYGALGAWNSRPAEDKSVTFTTTYRTYNIASSNANPTMLRGMASGATVLSPTLALVGEGGYREDVISQDPRYRAANLARLAEAAAGLGATMVSRASGGYSAAVAAGAPITIHVNADSFADESRIAAAVGSALRQVVGSASMTLAPGR
jgi:hypothetical protein